MKNYDVGQFKALINGKSKAVSSYCDSDLIEFLADGKIALT